MAGLTIRQLQKDKRSKERKQADFLSWFSELASVARSCRKAKVSRATFYVWYNNPKEAKFRALYEEACKQALVALEDEAVRRAFEGVNRPVFQNGKKVGQIKEYSDTLLIVLLKARDPEKYKERFHKIVTGQNGGPVEVERTIKHVLVVKKGNETLELTQPAPIAIESSSEQ